MKEVMNRSAADNAYMHKDFHGALSRALIYLQDRFGDESVREYLRQFATAFYAPLRTAINERGLVAIKEHYTEIYALEGGVVEFSGGSDDMVMKAATNPAVVYLREQGQPVSPLFVETIKTVNETICEDTPFVARMLSYDEATGASAVRFTRRHA
jgi:ClpP class serine protease